MIRRNVANQPIYFPQLRLSATGAAVTSGASLVVAIDGTEGASAGTLTHYAGGVWKYVPTQSETNCAMIGLILTATDSDTIVLNLITTGADTSAVAFGANTVAPSNSTIALIYALLQLTDADVALIKSVTDQFVFTNPGQVDAHAELDSAALALINKIEASTAGTVSGAGTDTEIFVGSNVTLTITVDEDGNRSAVVVS